MKFDTYTIVARLFPALLSSFPIFVLYFFLLNPALGKFLNGLLSLQVASNATISLALVYAFSQINRYLSKQLIEKKLFKDGLNLPTTSYLTFADSNLSTSYKVRVRAKIQTDFDIRLPDPEDEARDHDSARRQIAEAVEQVRSRVGAGRLTHQHNAEYGFIRNFAGGSIVALCFSILDVAIFGIVLRNNSAFLVSLLASLVYLVVIMFAQRLITSFGQNYAKVLIQEYMSK